MEGAVMTWKLEGFDATELSTAISLIMQERFRQHEKGYDSEHDKSHNGGELVKAAMALASRGGKFRDMGWSGIPSPTSLWPFKEQMPQRKTSTQDLVIAASLLVAEIERRLIADGN
jgi:hypothetical protein